MTTDHDHEVQCKINVENQVNDMTVPEIKAALDKLHVKYKPRANRQTVVDLLINAMHSSPSKIDDKEHESFHTDYQLRSKERFLRSQSTSTVLTRSRGKAPSSSIDRSRKTRSTRKKSSPDGSVRSRTRSTRSSRTNTKESEEEKSGDEKTVDGKSDDEESGDDHDDRSQTSSSTVQKDRLTSKLNTPVAADWKKVRVLRSGKKIQLGDDEKKALEQLLSGEKAPTGEHEEKQSFVDVALVESAQEMMMTQPLEPVKEEKVEEGPSGKQEEDEMNSKSYEDTEQSDVEGEVEHSEGQQEEKEGEHDAVKEEMKNQQQEKTMESSSSDNDDQEEDEVVLEEEKETSQLQQKPIGTIQEENDLEEKGEEEEEYFTNTMETVVDFPQQQEQQDPQQEVPAQQPEDNTQSVQGDEEQVNGIVESEMGSDAMDVVDDVEEEDDDVEEEEDDVDEESFFDARDGREDSPPKIHRQFTKDSTHSHDEELKEQHIIDEKEEVHEEVAPSEEEEEDDDDDDKSGEEGDPSVIELVDSEDDQPAEQMETEESSQPQVYNKPLTTQQRATEATALSTFTSDSSSSSGQQAQFETNSSTEQTEEQGKMDPAAVVALHAFDKLGKKFVSSIAAADGAAGAEALSKEEYELLKQLLERNKPVSSSDNTQNSSSEAGEGGSKEGGKHKSPRVSFEGAPCDPRDNEMDSSALGEENAPRNLSLKLFPDMNSSKQWPRLPTPHPEGVNRKRKMEEQLESQQNGDSVKESLENVDPYDQYKYSDGNAPKRRSLEGPRHVGFSLPLQEREESPAPFNPLSQRIPTPHHRASVGSGVLTPSNYPPLTFNMGSAPSTTRKHRHSMGSGSGPAYTPTFKSHVARFSSDSAGKSSSGEKAASTGAMTVVGSRSGVNASLSYIQRRRLQRQSEGVASTVVAKKILETLGGLSTPIEQYRRKSQAAPLLGTLPTSSSSHMLIEDKTNSVASKDADVSVPVSQVVPMMVAPTCLTAPPPAKQVQFTGVESHDKSKEHSKEPIVSTPFATGPFPKFTFGEDKSQSSTATTQPKPLTTPLLFGKPPVPSTSTSADEEFTFGEPTTDLEPTDMEVDGAEILFAFSPAKGKRPPGTPAAKRSRSVEASENEDNTSNKRISSETTEQKSETSATTPVSTSHAAGSINIWSMPQKGVKCGVCMVMNKEGATKCASCESSLESSKKSEKPKSGTEESGAVDIWAASMKSDGVKCGVCMVMNKKGAAKCVSCESSLGSSIGSTDPKPSSGFSSVSFGTSSAVDSSKPTLASGFTFGKPTSTEDKSTEKKSIEAGTTQGSIGLTGFSFPPVSASAKPSADFGFGSVKPTDASSTKIQFGFPPAVTAAPSNTTNGFIVPGGPKLDTRAPAVSDREDIEDEQPKRKKSFGFGSAPSEESTKPAQIGFTFPPAPSTTIAPPSTTGSNPFSFDAPKTDSSAKPAPFSGFTFGNSNSKPSDETKETKKEEGGFTFPTNIQDVSSSGSNKRKESSSSQETQEAPKPFIFGSTGSNNPPASSTGFQFGSKPTFPALPKIDEHNKSSAATDGNVAAPFIFGSKKEPSKEAGPANGLGSTFGSTNSFPSVSSSADLSNISKTNTTATGGEQASAPKPFIFGAAPSSTTTDSSKGTTPAFPTAPTATPAPFIFGSSAPAPAGGNSFLGFGSTGDTATNTKPPLASPSSSTSLNATPAGMPFKFGSSGSFGIAATGSAPAATDTSAGNSSAPMGGMYSPTATMDMDSNLGPPVTAGSFSLIPPPATNTGTLSTSGSAVFGGSTGFGGVNTFGSASFGATPTNNSGVNLPAFGTQGTSGSFTFGGSEPSTPMFGGFGGSNNNNTNTGVSGGMFGSAPPVASNPGFMGFGGQAQAAPQLGFGGGGNAPVFGAPAGGAAMPPGAGGFSLGSAAGPKKTPTGRRIVRAKRPGNQ